MRFLRSAFFVLFGSVLFSSAVFASGIGVKPLRTELFINPGSSQSAVITVINGEQQDIQAQPTIEVYTKNDESGFPVSIDLDTDDPRNIESWVSFSEDMTELPAGGEQQVTVTVTVPEGAEPGGRYAAVLYEPITEPGEGGVQIRSRVASLLLITVGGEQIRSGEVQSFTLSENAANDKPLNFDIQFENTGNVHLSPSGTVTLTDQDGNVLENIARYMDRETGEEIVSNEIPANPNNGNVLPGSFRIFGAEWNENIQTGTFTAELNLRFPGSNEPIVRSTEFSFEEDFALDRFDLDRTENGADFILKMSNDGTLQERPVGMITVENEFGQMVSEIEMPEDLEYTLPGESTTYTIPWIAKELPEGKYTATINLKQGVTNYDVSDSITFGTKTNWASILGILAVVVISGMGYMLVNQNKPKKKKKRK